MPDCEYCEASFDTEDAYLAHLHEEHDGELGRIDRRRVRESDTAGGSGGVGGSGGANGGDGDEEGVAAGPVVIAVIVVAALALVAYFVVAGGGSGSASASQPQNIGGPHYHGIMTMTVDGQQVDFSQQQYQLQDRAFHFEGGNGQRWHGHASGITLEYAIETLGIEVTGSTVTYDDTTYNRSEGDTVSIRVNGGSVPPGEYVLEEGDRINVTVRSG